MNADNLENRIRALPEPNLPEGWRAEILRNARSERLRTNEATSWWPHWLTTGRISFAALAATWLMILALHSEGETTIATPPATQVEATDIIHHLERQERMLVEIPTNAPAPKHVAPPLGDRRRIENERGRLS